jgi:Domain of unknown function (DUF4159)
MCDHCPLPASPGETRRGFLRKLAGAAATASLLGSTRTAAQENSPPAVANSGWARIWTRHPEWDVHSDREERLIDFIRRDRELKFTTKLGVAHPSNLEDLCKTPFLFSFDLTAMDDPQEWTNLREYLYRGGFLYLDNCVHVSPDMQAFRHDHLLRLTRLLPASEMRRLSPEHPIYRARYPIKLDQLPGDQKTSAEQHGALYGVFDDNRMVALLSLAHLFCGWPENPGIVEACMKQLTNIYVYSRAH